MTVLNTAPTASPVVRAQARYKEASRNKESGFIFVVVIFNTGIVL